MPINLYNDIYMNELNELDYIGAGELVFNIDGLGIASGGFSVNSIMMKAGMSPIKTANSELIGGANNKVSDLFNNLVVPNWALSYGGSSSSSKEHNNNNTKKTKEKDDDEDDDVVNDDLFNKLFELVKHDDLTKKTLKKKMTRKNKKQEHSKKNKSRKATF